MSTIQIVPEDRVRALAHSLWMDEGQPDGRAEAHWFKALELVNAEAMAPSGELPTAAKPKGKAPAAVAVAKKAAPRKTGKA